MGKSSTVSSPPAVPRMDPPPPYDAPSIRSSSEASTRPNAPLASRNTNRTVNPARQEPGHAEGCCNAGDSGGCMNYDSPEGCCNYRSSDGCMNYESEAGCLNFRSRGGCCNYEADEGACNFRKNGGCCNM